MALVKINAVPAQQFAVFLLKRASAVVLLLHLNVSHHAFELTRAHRKRAIPALPERAAVASVKRFDPLRGHLLYVLDEFGLKSSSRQRGDNENVISNTADAHEVGAQITADCREIRVHAWPHVEVETSLAILSAKNDVENDFTYRLRHSVNDYRIGAKSETHFQRWRLGIHKFLGRCPRLT
jgi:hypothetical protein